MSSQNNDTNGWATVGKSNKKKTNPIILSVAEQEKLKNEQLANPVQNDSRFTNVVLSKPKKTNTTTKVHSQYGGKNTQRQSDVDMRKIERGEIRLPTSTKELATQIQQARAAKNLTQDQLDKACSFPTKTIKNYENCTGIVSQNQLNTMSKILGVALKKPKNIKMTQED